MSSTKLNRNILLYYLVEFFSELVFIIPIWVSYERQFLTFTELSLLAGARYAMTLLLELPTGAFADLLGRKTSIMIASILGALGLGIIGFAENGAHVIAGTLLRGMSDSFISGSLVAIVYDSLKEQGKEHLYTSVRSKGVMISQFAIMISGVFGGYFFTLWKGLPYLAFAATHVAAAITAVFMVEPAVDTERFALTSYIAQTKRGVTELLATAYTKNLSVYYALVGALTWMWQVHISQIYATAIGYSEVEKGWLFALIRLTNMIIIFWLTKQAFIHAKRWVFFFFPVVITAASLSAVIQWLPLNTLILFPLTLMSSLRFAILERFANDEFTSKNRATALSALNFAVGILFILMVALAGPLLDLYPPWVTVFFIGVLSLFTLVPQAFRLMRHI